MGTGPSAQREFCGDSLVGYQVGSLCGVCVGFAQMLCGVCGGTHVESVYGLYRDFEGSSVGSVWM